jgi:beta-glucanase (GH16 family)
MHRVFGRALIMGILAGLTLLSLPSFGATPLGPPTWGNPDRPWGIRRPVAAVDRALIAKYRAGSASPVLATTFSNPATLQSQWNFISDDDLKSCRRPQNVVATSNGLQLQTRAGDGCRAKWSTGFIISKRRQKFGFFEATMKAGDISGLNNAFWLVTEDHFEVDIAEVHYPNIVRLTLHNNNDWDTIKEDKMHAVGFNSTFADNFSGGFHDFGVLWTPTDIIYEIDGEPIAAIATQNAINGSADIRFSSALMDYAGKIPGDPAGHSMFVKSLRVYPLLGE